MEFEENQDFDSVSRKMLWKESFFENERPAKGLNQRLGWTSLQGSISHMLKPKAAAQRLIALTCLEVVCTTKRNKSNQEGILNQLELISSEARRRWWFRRLGWWFRWGRTVVVGRIKQKKMEIGGEGGWEKWEGGEGEKREGEEYGKAGVEGRVETRNLWTQRTFGRNR